jgi:decaprenylphospho-beta-D-ribofuranose 2-oxidase
MNAKTKTFSNFGHFLKTSSKSLRPDTEAKIQAIVTQRILARGQGLSYNDSCVNDRETIIDTSRLNHILSFDAKSGIAVCQAAVSFADLFSIDADFIPPVMPGTLAATLAGGLAHDVHGKNNPHAGSFGQHIAWFDLQIGAESFHCSPTQNQDLFYASIAGLGLTGIIKRLAIKLTKASRLVSQTTEKWTDLAGLLTAMQTNAQQHDYQVAWLDLLNNTPRALLRMANHLPHPKHDFSTPALGHFKIPSLPVRAVRSALMKPFNRFYFQWANTKTQNMPLWEFNNPLDKLKDWNRLYGRQGLLQFQAVFDEHNALQHLENLLALIKKHGAAPSLAVLKYFEQKGCGLMSFVQPGFTIAIDFIHHPKARLAIAAMNQYIMDIGGKVYLAKDILLTREQFIHMYPEHEALMTCLKTYKSPMQSGLSQRLGLSS